MNNGIKTNGGEKLGKTIIFAYNHHHAEMIVECFRQMYPSHPANYCQLVDNYVKYADDLITKFEEDDEFRIEVFIRMFIDEMFYIAKRGLKSSYQTVSSNENVFKGKILFSEQIKQNYAHKEKAFVEYDEFNTNRPENKLIKSTLLYLYRQASSLKNKTDIRTLLNAFSEVEPSVDYEGDYAKYCPDRNTKDYSTALLWSRVFLMGKSFTSFSGSEVAVALLFPMETLFESYVAVQLKKILEAALFKVTAQDKSYHLFSYPSKKFLMKPDIAITRKDDKAIFICDTKWKLLADEKANYGISQGDMYQMYAYQKKYVAQNITLTMMEEKLRPRSV